MVVGSASIVIDRPASVVFEALTDVTRMGEWSPECVAGRWIAPATGPAVGARFEGDNVAALGPLTLKRWTTTSEVTELVPDRVFEFSAEGYPTWRYELADVDGGTRVTESYEHPAYEGWQKVVYGGLVRRSAGLVRGMERTLGRLKASLER